MDEYQWTISGEEITGEKLQSVDTTVELTVPVGEKYTGQTGRLYYYNENHALELIDSSVVGDDGRIALEFTHASDYVIVIGDTVSSPVDNRW